MALVMYGIRNCDTVKKARAWLDAAGVAYEFHDFKAKGAEAAAVSRWVAALGWEVVLNRAGTTFRGLPEAERTGLDAGRAVALMVAQPAMVKRPVIEGVHAGQPILMVGFKGYADVFGG